LSTLDTRYTLKTKKEGLLVARKVRKEGRPSPSVPHSGIPEWAVDPEWDKGLKSVHEYMYLFASYLSFSYFRETAVTSSSADLAVHVYSTVSQL